MTTTSVSGRSYTAAETRSMPLEVMGPREALEGTPVESGHKLYDEDGTTVMGLWECTPGRFMVSKRGKHSMMYIISGRGTVTEADGTVHVLEPGAALMEPDGWVGEWHITETIRKFYVFAKS